MTLSLPTWRRWGACLSLLATTLLAACGGGGGGEATAAGNGTLRVAMTDAPSCGYDHVWVTVSKVSVHTSASAGENDAGWADLTLNPPRRIDLLSLTNGALEELGTTPLPAGSYQQVRLVLAANNATTPTANAVQPTGGAVIALNTPSAQQSGLKLQAHFDVQPNQLADLVIDFDACRSVVKAGNSGNYNLKPVLSVTKRLVAAIQGYVSTTVTAAPTTVTAQQNGTVVRATTPDATGKFTLAYLPDGSYDVVVTSEGRSTAVITSVPVASTTGITTVTSVATAITPTTSTMATVTGTTTLTGGAVLGDATLNALQPLTAGPTVLIATTPVDATLGTYTLRLPTAAPLRAPYAATGPVFTADTAAAGRYTVQALSTGRATQQQSLTLSGNTGVNFTFAP